MTSPLDGKVVPFGKAVDTLHAFLNEPVGDVDTGSGTMPNLRKLAVELRVIAAATADETAGDKVTSIEDRIYPGVYSTPPTNKPHSGAPSADGDRCVILVNGTPTEHIRSGGGWLIPNFDAQQLAMAATLPIMAFSAIDAQSIFDNALPMQSHATLRAYAGRAKGVRMNRPGLARVFQLDTSDQATPDNGGTVIVDANGGRWKSGEMDVRPEYFGAMGGAADDTANFQKALDYAISSGLRLLVSRVHKINGALSNTTGKDVHITFEGGAYLDGTASTAAGVLVTLGGSLGSSFTLAADATKGTRSIQVTGHNFAVGDVLRIQSTDLWNPTRPYYYRGEMARVTGVVGATVSLDNPLYDTYFANTVQGSTSITTQVTKYNMGRCILENFRVRRNGPNGGLYVQYVRDYLISNPDISGANERCLYLLECFNGTLDSATLKGVMYAGGGTNYGLSIGSCQHIKIAGGYFVGGRHGLAIGGTFPVRDIQIDKITVDNDPAGNTYCFDSHGNCEFLTVTNCHSMNGAMLQSINTRVIGGEYRSNSYTSAALGFIPEVSGDYLEISNVYAQNFAGLTCVLVSLYSDALTFNRLDLTRIFCKPMSNAGSIPGMVMVQTNNGAWTGTIKRINIKEVQGAFPSAPAAGSKYGIAVGANTNITGDLTISDCDVSAGFIYSRSFYFKVVGKIMSSRNVYRGYDTANYSGVVAGGDFYSKDDTFDGGGTAVYTILTTTGRVVLENPTFTGFTSLGGLYAQFSNDVMIVNPTRVSTAGVFSTPLTTAYSQLTAAGTKVLYRNAAPTVGAWAVGDSVVNTVPVVGQPKGWRCTVAGTPGTWVSEGNL